MKNGSTTCRRAVLRTLLMAGTVMCGTQAAAQTDEASDTMAEDAYSYDIIVTATRRSETAQSVPFNIAAVGADQIESQRLLNLREIARSVPGVYLVDTGSRAAQPIVFRGLNATPLGSGDGANDSGGTVATYVGEIPLYVDLRLNDMERVEFLLGPQGTLYGAGTLGGAIRYIPKRPKIGVAEGEVRADAYSYKYGSGLSTDTGMTVNVPLGDMFAFRGSIDLLNDRGFIDYPYVVRQPGVSDAEPDFSDPAAVAANLRKLKDVNDEDTVSGRAALRFQPSDAFTADFTYYYQKQDTSGRQLSGVRQTHFPVEVGKYEYTARVPEPNSRRNELFALELTADLGFAELTSASGYSKYREQGQRDQTDLLIALEYSYEQFPTFTAYTSEFTKERTYNQELRLVSQSEGPFSWIVGAFYNDFKYYSTSAEYTPGYDVFVGGSRPDALEYYSVDTKRLKEAAGYGELSYEITDKWQVTAGGRYYHYKLKTSSAFDVPLYYTVFEGRDPNSIELVPSPGGQKDSGFLFKFNTSYKFTPDAMAYFTVSQGYRQGNSNGVVACPVAQPNPCATPREFEYTPDKTLNFELGAKTQWFDRKLTLNASVYYIKWSDPQVDSATVQANVPITINGAGARTQGFELLAAYKFSPELSIRATYAYTDPELTDDTPFLIRELLPPGFGLGFIDGQKGDRLPGSPKHQGNVSVDYEREIGGEWKVGASYGMSIQSNVLTTTGGRGGGLKLPGFDRHNASLSLSDDSWSFTLYCDNIFDDFSEVGVRLNPRYNQVLTDADGGAVYHRGFGTYVLSPRTVGLRVTKKFGPSS